MNKPLLELKDIVETVNPTKPINILNHVNFKIYSGDFITVLGTNGAGKSTLFNAIGGNLNVTSGQVILKGKDITNQSVVRRTHFLGRVFQDPKMGTAPRMTVAENLLLAEKRGKSRGLKPRHLKKHLPEYRNLTAKMNNNLDQRLNTPTGNLSGGQRQSLSFLMATITKPDVLLLDEHTAALDPQSSAQLMRLTDETIRNDHLTCLMITHDLQDALKYGNRLIVLSHGQIVHDFNRTEKQQLTLGKLSQLFDQINA